ncbi:hypothetical protein J2858_002086 [Neorhizobium galegae]|uniref:hypothetical protein n=1 Tax=Rhizobium/Agrobacterium group TaxID=227290 RepID=UPI001AE37A1C|nr:hypothetical protein [Neorhizobium galegae]MBP2549163.1 hypothetical protein [Neorhizobium galegae]
MPTITFNLANISDSQNQVWTGAQQTNGQVVAQLMVPLAGGAAISFPWDIPSMTVIFPLTLSVPGTNILHQTTLMYNGSNWVLTDEVAGLTLMGLLLSNGNYIILLEAAQLA